MNNTTKIGAEVRPVNTLTVPVVSGAHIVRDDAHTASGARIPSADLHARRIAREGEKWLAFATERSRMRGDTLVRKAFDCVAFSVQHSASSLAVPSKLVGTREHQRALWTLVREITPRWSELEIEEVPGGALVVRYDDTTLGEVQRKHAPWLRPLVPFGCRLYLDRVTGHEREGYTLGVNVVFGHVGASLDALLHALGQGYGGDGASGDGPVEAPVAPTPHESGDGLAGDGFDGAFVPVLAQHEALTGSNEDVVLWREVDGTARASVAHLTRHSPTGVEWGYGGSGPADLARSVLVALAGEAVAERHYQDFKAEVVARVPYEGGVIRATAVRAWLARQR